MKNPIMSILAGLTSATLLISQTGAALALQTPQIETREAPASTTIAPPPPGYVTGPMSGTPLEIAHAYLSAQKGRYGLTDTDLADFVVSDEYTDDYNGLTHLYLVQRWQGIEVLNGIFNFNIDQQGRILFVGNRWVSDLAGQVNTTRPTLSAVQAVEKAAAHNGLVIAAPLTQLDFSTTPDHGTLLSNGGISQNPIPAKLAFDVSGKQPRLVWNVTIYTLDAQHWWNTRVDAVTGEVISQNDWVIHEDFDAQLHDAQATHAAHTNVASGPVNLLAPHAAAEVTVATAPAAPAFTTFMPISPVADGSSYKVYPWPVESPNHTTPLPPADGRVVVTEPADGLGSPYGWHDTNGVAGAEFTTTVGNNVQAYTDVDANNSPDPGSSPTGTGALNLTFNFTLDLTQAPSAYRPAAVTNLFYWNNLMHDIPYRYGFTEAAGNFQVNNYGRGGTGNDSVQAEAQDGSGTNNANFSTPADGSRPRMQMYIWTAPTPDKDGDVDNGIIAHEYGHGISNRLTGGPSNVSCLGNSEQMGEGWSDWQSIFTSMSASENFVTGRGIGTYALDQAVTGVGIRPAKYSTDMAVNNYTYANLASMAIPHGVGFVWNTMLYEMLAALSNKYGINPDLYGAWNTGGNNLAYQLVSDGMKIQPCSPGFVDGRNAILAADTALTGGANQCTIWAAFAKRGLGYSALQGSTSSTSDGTAAYDMPPGCMFLSATTTTQNVCQGSPAQYTIQVGAAFSSPVNMTATGNPVPTTATFNPNPVTGVPTNTILTIGNTASAAVGSYNLQIRGNNVATAAITTTLNIYAGSPAIPALTTPANGATNVSLNPSFSWGSVSGAASYNLQVATDMAFSNVVYSTTVAGTTASGPSLSGNTTYYWRVRALNPCGNSAYAAPFSFSTLPVFCSNPNLVIADNATATNNMSVVPVGTLTDLNVSISGTHTWVGDMTFTITKGATSVTFVDRPGYTTTGFGCSSDNFVPEVDDEGTDGPVENQCATNPALFGKPTPNNPLSAFDGMSFDGTWTISVRDSAGGDTGVLQQWCLVPTLASTAPAPAISLAKTVGTDSATCASGDSLAVAYGTEVTYCYTATNTGNITLTTHTLTDTHLGTLLSNFSYSLAPGASAFITESAIMTQTTVNTGFWMATEMTYTASASDMATVTVLVTPTIAVSPNPMSYTQSANSTVTHTLTINNTGLGSSLVWSITEGAHTLWTMPSWQPAASTVGLADLTTARDAATSSATTASLRLDPTYRHTPQNPASVLYNNGPLVNSPGTGSGGADESVLQTTSLGMSTIGFGHQIANTNSVADDFTVPASGWHVDTLEFFAYQTGSTTTSTINDVRYRIWNGAPNGGGSIIYGDLTTNRLASSSFANIYRVTETTLGNTQRPVMRNVVAGNFDLPAGTYWIEWTTGGTLASGPWAPAITINGQASTGNGLQNLAGVWGNANDGGTGTPQQGFPFIINGTAASANCSTPSDAPWLTLSPTSGTTLGGNASGVSVGFNTTGLTAGNTYTATLCVASNDLTTPLVEVPVTLTVQTGYWIFGPFIWKP
jgi:hypothetical protein